MAEAVARAIDLGLILCETHPEHPHTIPRNNLPRQLTSFIGREGEIAQFEGLVGTCALVTVTGAGGVGKTRLALEAAARLAAALPQRGLAGGAGPAFQP